MKQRAFCSIKCFPIPTKVSGVVCLFSLVIYTSGRWRTVVNLTAAVGSPLPWDDSKETIEQLLSASINTEKQSKATLFVSLEDCPAGLPNVLCVYPDAEC